MCYIIYIRIHPFLLSFAHAEVSTLHAHFVNIFKRVYRSVVVGSVVYASGGDSANRPIHTGTFLLCIRTHTHAQSNGPIAINVEHQTSFIGRKRTLFTACFHRLIAIRNLCNKDKISNNGWILKAKLKLFIQNFSHFFKEISQLIWRNTRLLILLQHFLAWSKGTAKIVDLERGIRKKAQKCIHRSQGIGLETAT